MRIDPAAATPLYQQVAADIRRKIVSGEMPIGTQLQPHRELAVSYGVSVITIKRAYSDLEREGVIVTRQGRGSFVADLADLSTRLRLDELDAHLTAAADLARELGVPAKALESRLHDAVRKRNRNER